MALVHSFIWPSMADLITLKGLRRTQSPGVFEKKKTIKKQRQQAYPVQTPSARSDKNLFISELARQRAYSTTHF